MTFENMFSLAWTLNPQVIIDEWTKKFNFRERIEFGSLITHVFKDFVCIAFKTQYDAWLYFVDRKNVEYVHSIHIPVNSLTKEKYTYFTWVFCENCIVFLDYHTFGGDTRISVMNLQDFTRKRTEKFLEATLTLSGQSVKSQTYPFYITHDYLYYIGWDGLVRKLSMDIDAEKVYSLVSDVKGFPFKVESSRFIERGVVFIDDHFLVVAENPFVLSIKIRTVLIRHDLKNGDKIELDISYMQGKILYWNDYLYFWHEHGISRVAVKSFGMEEYRNCNGKNWNFFQDHMMCATRSFVMYCPTATNVITLERTDEFYCEFPGMTLPIFPDETNKVVSVSASSENVLVRWTDSIKCFRAPLEIGKLKFIQQKCWKMYDAFLEFK